MPKVHTPARANALVGAFPRFAGAHLHAAPVGKKGGSTAGLPVYFYRKDAKGGAAHSVRDRLTAPLAKQVCFVGVRIAPTPPWKRRALHPSLLERGGCAAGAHWKMATLELATFSHWQHSAKRPRNKTNAPLCSERCILLMGWGVLLCEGLGLFDVH